KVYSDAGFTGANVNRPALTEMLQHIHEGEINLVMAYKIDRLTRSPKDFYQLIELFEKHGVDFISVTERFDTSTPSGRLLRNIMLTFAQFERELTSERTRDKLLQRAQKGMWNGGVVPLGYKRVEKKLVIEEKEAEIVRSIYGIYTQHGSLFKVYRDLKTSNIRGRKGEYFSKHAVAYALRNIAYTGKMRYAGKLYDALHEPIITEETFKLAQTRHKEKIVKEKLYKHYTLAGLVKCKDCGSIMTPTFTNKKRKNKKMKRYYYYRCTKTFTRDWKDCSVRQINAEKLEDIIFENLSRIAKDRQYVESLIFCLNSYLMGGRTGLEKTFEPPQISHEIFAQTLQSFMKNMSKCRGEERNFWSKTYIKSIKYSKEEIALTLYYKISFENENSVSSTIVRSAADAARNLSQKISPILKDRAKRAQWLPKQDSN
ncbi:MAG TPA: recombinase family protein, partial [Candidatus Omnitrophica bacterium]|nr:recombinase family protein [Candidatus Omnitrophota bacterium]